MNNSTSNNITNLFQQFYQHQKEMLRCHEQYVKSQSQSFQAFLQLLQQQQISIPQTPTTSVEPPIFATPEPVITEAVNQPVVEIPKVNPEPVAEPAKESPQPVAEPAHISDIASYLKPRANYVTTPEPTPTVTETAPAVAQDSSVSKALLEVVSDKTGYPTEMLELEMDLEADLGIDSIKRVEIMGTLQESFPQLPKLSPEELAEKRTLGQIVQYLEAQTMVTEKKIV